MIVTVVLIVFMLILAYCGDDTPSDFDKTAWLRFKERTQRRTK